MWRRRHCCVGATLRRRFDELVTLSLRHVPTGHAVLPEIPTMSTTDIKGNAEFPLICSLGVPAILIENVLTPSFFMVVYTNMNKILLFSLFSDGNIKNINICWDPLTPCNSWRTVATRKIYILGLLDRIHDVRIRVGRRGFSDEVSGWLASVPANHMPCFGGPLSPIAWDSVWELFGNTSHYEILQTFCKHLLKIWENIDILSVIPMSSRVFRYTYCRNHWFELLMSVNRIGDVGDMIDNIQN